MAERQWLYHAEIGGYFHCPVEAVDAWGERGWKPSDPPPEPVNPAVAESLAWRAEQLARQETKPAKSTKTGSAGSDKKE